MRYLIIIEKGENNYGAYAPDVPGCVTVGDTVEETKRNMREALGLHLAGMLQDGEKLPEPVSTAVQLDVQPLPDEQIFEVASARAAREKMRLSQPEFAKLLGVPVATLRNWEQGRTCPDGPGLALLRLATERPDVVLDLLHTKRRKKVG